MDYRKKAAALLFRRIHENGGTLTIERGNCPIVTLCAIERLVEDGRIEIVTRDAQMVTYRRTPSALQGHDE